jgi:prepilin-type N-terminal cleavage/methylation domain-containing protein
MCPQSPASRTRAFTLIEAMIVVAIVGILSVLAIVAYHRWVRTAYIAEAHDMLSNIRSAEESFKAENGTYLNVSAALEPGNLYPASTPGAFKTAWGGPCANCAVSWSTLNVESKAAVAFGYAVVASNLASDGRVPTTITIDGAAVNVTPPTYPAYAAEAAGDIDGNSVFTRVYVFSSTNQFFVDNEGE